MGVKKAVNSDKIDEGINCAVCHNIDKIHKSKDDSVRGIHLVEWMKPGKMSGPFKDAKSPYHETYYRDFMGKNSNELCFVCHANNRSNVGHIFSNTQAEYQSVKNPKACVACHMSEKMEGVASNLAFEGGGAKERHIRRHTFLGAHSPELLDGAINISMKKAKGKVIVQLQNPNPHNIPTGYGGRAIIVDVQFSGVGKYPAQSFTLTSKFTNKRNKKSVPHCATEIKSNEFIPAMGNYDVEVNPPQGAASMEVKVYFVLVNEEIRDILKLEEAIWSEKMLMAKKRVKL